MNFHVMVDSGLLSNYPIHIFDSTKYIHPDSLINMYQQNKFTLGLLLDKPEQFHYKQPGNYPLPIHTLKRLCNFCVSASHCSNYLVVKRKVIYQKQSQRLKI